MIVTIWNPTVHDARTNERRPRSGIDPETAFLDTDEPGALLSWARRHRSIARIEELETRRGRYLSVRLVDPYLSASELADEVGAVVDDHRGEPRALPRH